MAKKRDESARWESHPRGSIARLAGILHRPGLRAISDQAMNRAMAEFLATDDARILSRAHEPR